MTFMPDWLARSYPRSTAVQEVAVRSSGVAYLSVETFHPTSDSSRAAVGGWQKDGHLVLVNGLEAYPGTVWLGAPTVSKLT